MTAARAGALQHCRHTVLRACSTLSNAAVVDADPVIQLSSLAFQEARSGETQVAQKDLLHAARHGASTEKLERQLELETMALEENAAAYKEVIESVVSMNRGSQLGPAQKLLTLWFAPLVKAIDAEQLAITQGRFSKDKGVDRNVYGPYLLLVKPEKLAVMTMHEALSSVLNQGGLCKFTFLAERIGQFVQAEVNLMKLKSENRKLWSTLRGPLDSKKLQKLRMHARKALDEPEWPVQHRVKLGAALLKLMLQSAYIDVPVSDEDRAVHGGSLRAAAKRARLQLPSPEAPVKTSKLGEFSTNKDHRKGDSRSLTVLEGDVEGAFWDEARVLESDVPPPAHPHEGRADSEDEADPADAITHVSMPAFMHVKLHGSQGNLGAIRAHPRVVDLFKDTAVGYSHVTTFPMVVPPRPWTRPDKGGYLRQRVPLIRPCGSKIQAKVLAEGVHMPQVYEGLNVLGSVPWRINNEVLDVLKAVWEGGGGIADVPPHVDMPLPDEPDVSDIADAEEAKLVLRRFNRTLKKVRQGNADLHSLRCDMKLKLRVADMFKEEPNVYFPFNMDFRGRVYPVPPHLNHMGADVCRGLLTFADSKPLGERGLYWLQVHISNLFGVDKVSFDDRVAYVQEHMSEVFDTADRPLDGRQWWLKADSPWQALAACMELAAAMRSDDPLAYCTRLPVHQDGSCNGLQHYAALGRDEPGAKAVNLVGHPKPQDVYSEVLRLVQSRIEADADAPDPPADMPEHERAVAEGDRAAARFVRGHVNRKVVKQTVMTSVYGVTFIGAREQIRARLQEKFDPAVNEDAAKMHVDDLDNAVYQASIYLAKTTLGSLGEMFAAADAIKDWLSHASRVAAQHNQPMCWITPLGLPVVQPYRRHQAVLVRTVLQDVCVIDDSDKLPVSSQRQKSAFPPNYVHSLDSTHMFLTAIDCAQKGLTFTAVHDSYWTHPCDVDVMSASLREQFVKLYSMPLLEDLRSQLQLRFPETTFPELPERGVLDLNHVKESSYFFS